MSLPNVSPQPNTNNQENLNCNTNMKKNRIRLTESQLHRVIKESVKKALNEISVGTAISAHKKHNQILMTMNGVMIMIMINI